MAERNQQPSKEGKRFKPWTEVSEDLKYEFRIRKEAPGRLTLQLDACHWGPEGAEPYDVLHGRTQVVASQIAGEAWNIQSDPDLISTFLKLSDTLSAVAAGFYMSMNGPVISRQLSAAARHEWTLMAKRLESVAIGDCSMADAFAEVCEANPSRFRVTEERDPDVIERARKQHDCEPGFLFAIEGSWPKVCALTPSRVLH